MWYINWTVIILCLKAKNNEAEYEVLIGGIHLAKEMGETILCATSDSQLVTNKTKVDYHIKEPQLLKYLLKVRYMSKRFKFIEVIHVPREENVRVNILSKFTNTKDMATTKQ